MTSAMSSPMASSCAESDATCAIWSLPSTGWDMDLDLVSHGCHSLLQAALDGHGVRTGGHVLEAFLNDGLCQHRGGGGSVAGNVIGLAGRFLDELSAHVLERVFERDLLCDGHAVAADQWRPKRLVQNHVASAGSQRHLDGFGQLVCAGLEGLAGIFREYQLLCHFDSYLQG